MFGLPFIDKKRRKIKGKDLLKRKQSRIEEEEDIHNDLIVIMGVFFVSMGMANGMMKIENIYLYIYITVISIL